MDLTDMKNRERFGAVMKGLSVNSGAEITDDMILLYSKALKNFTIDQIEHAGVDILKIWKYNRMPPLAIIIEHIEGNAQPIDDRALVIANQIVSHLNLWGSSKYPDLKEDPIAVELMSRRWPYKIWAANVIESELKWWVKEFCEAYRSYSESDTQRFIEAPAEVKELASGMLKSI